MTRKELIEELLKFGSDDTKVYIRQNDLMAMRGRDRAETYDDTPDLHEEDGKIYLNW